MFSLSNLASSFRLWIVGVTGYVSGNGSGEEYGRRDRVDCWTDEVDGLSLMFNITQSAIGLRERPKGLRALRDADWTGRTVHDGLALAAACLRCGRFSEGALHRHQFVRSCERVFQRRTLTGGLQRQRLFREVGTFQRLFLARSDW
jgi:hypothetical protein